MSALHLPSLQRWLQDHCESSDRVAGGLVIAASGVPGQAQTVAEWPVGGGMTLPLNAVAHAAVQRARRVMVAPTVMPVDARHNRVISLPVRSGERTLGAVALAVQVGDGESVEALFEDLERASADLGDNFSAAPATQSGGDAARVLELQDTLLLHASLTEGALAFVNDLAPMLGCERVALGVLEGGEMNVVAVSNSAEFKGAQELLRLMAGAMQEAADQGARVVYPAAPTDVMRIVIAHADLAARSGHAVASVALV
jgi:hypothetical protein